jgi:hypothetical protein
MVYGGLDRFLPDNHPLRESRRKFLPVTDSWLQEAAAVAHEAAAQDLPEPPSVALTGVISLPALCSLQYFSWSSCFLLEGMHILFNHGPRASITLLFNALMLRSHSTFHLLLPIIAWSTISLVVIGTILQSNYIDQQKLAICNRCLYI